LKQEIYTPVGVFTDRNMKAGEDTSLGAIATLNEDE
jgi:hypothetical protein